MRKGVGSTGKQITPSIPAEIVCWEEQWRGKRRAANTPETISRDEEETQWEKKKK